MKRMIGLAIATATMLGGCATFVEGRSQTIYMSVTPQEAQCTGWRDNQVAGLYYPMFQSMTVAKSEDDLIIICSAGGYRDKKVHLVSHASDLGVVGAPVDYFTGAMNKYDDDIIIVMEKS